MTVSSRALEAMQRRAQAVRARATIRRWEYRQRNLAHGVWYRWRALLARAEEAWAVSEDAIASLVSRGAVLQEVGRELEPPKQIVFASREDVPSDARPLALHLDADMLEAGQVVLVPFDPRRVRGLA